MASSNRHWPSMFKSKPTNTAHHHHQWQHDLNHRNPPTPERAPDPKPRWSPKPEQIRILEAIFNSGIVNPPRDEIRRIRVQLQAYGQIGDANVFYWFQNRKSRTKHKHRQLNKPQPTPSPPPSDHKPSPHNSNPEKALPPTTRVFDLLSGNNINNNNNNSSPVFLPAPGECSTEPPSFFTGQQSNAGSISTSIFAPSLNVNSSPTNYQVFQGIGESDPAPNKTSVFINDVCVEVAMGPFNVRETFGDDVVLLHSSGQPVPINEWGLTQQPLQNGAFYYLLRPFAPSPDDHDKTIHLI